MMGCASVHMYNFYYTFWRIIITGIITCYLFIHLMLFFAFDLSDKTVNSKNPRFIQKRSILSLLKENTDISFLENEETIRFKKLLQHPRVCQSCREFHQLFQGSEGQLTNNSEEYKLQQVHAFFSPGQTVPTQELAAFHLPTISCNINKLLSDKPKVTHFQETIYMYQNLQQGPNPLKVFPPTSKKRICSPGDLTPFGTLQQIRNGKILSEAYSHILSNISNLTLRKIINVQTIPEKLFYQNSLAFSVGFLNQEQAARIKVRKSLPNFAPKSMNADIYCPKLDKYSAQIENAVNSGQFIFKKSHTSTKHLIQHFNSKQIAKSSALEIVLTALSYLCNKLSPSCFKNKNKHCTTLTLDGLNEAFNMADSYHQSLTLDPFFTEISMLSTFPALKNILEQVANTNSSPFFHMYSSKHSFLLYLLRTLGIEVNKIPLFAARVIFEIYTNNKGLQFFRILFNGRDFTEKVLSCNTVGSQYSKLCPLSFLTSFVNEILTKFKSQTYTQACW